VNDVPPPPPPPYGSVPAPAGGPDVGAAISYGWNKFTQNVGPLIAIVVAPIVVLLVLEFVGFVVVRGFFGILFFVALALLVSMVAYLGIFNAGLMATSGQPVDFGKAFQTDRWGDWIVFSILYGLLLAVGYALCLIGALFVIAFWGLAPFYFLDQGKSAGEALSASLAATRSNPGLPLALGLLALVGWVGSIVCIGSLVTIPIAIIGAAFLYRQATGQSVAP
jgi:uncharacterized membrane protein